MDNSKISASLINFSRSLIPRLLTQVNRDPNHPSYGCFDRNWWHYKIRDFPSIILQQGSYTVFLIAQLTEWQDKANSLNKLAKAGCRFWTNRAIKSGAFEEYYPNEQGYPPLAFSSLSILKIVAQDKDLLREIQPGIKKAAKQLLKRFESKAANQQIAGLAAIAYINKFYPQYCSDASFLSIKKMTLALQDDEGWFQEYGGPDLGYLSVALDCLWDLYDLTIDEEYLTSAKNAFTYIAKLVVANNGNLGMHNSRNTDYLVPYGIVRFLYLEEYQEEAKIVYTILFENCDMPEHFFSSIDDRYFCHYIGHSIIRARLLLENKKIPFFNHKKIKESLTKKDMIYYPNCGYLVFTHEGVNNLTFLISQKKGGVFSAKNGIASLSDYGWIIKKGNRQFITHWWSDRWESNQIINEDTAKITIKGYLFPHRGEQPTPFLHIFLRLISKIAGYRIINLLKTVMIFKNKPGQFEIIRNINVFRDHILLDDLILNIDDSCEIIKAPRSSKRHVASSDSYHIEDIALENNVTVDTKYQKVNNGIKITTNYWFE